MNDELIEGQFHGGAIPTPKDPTIAQYADVAGDSLPFDWDKGYDVLDAFKEATGLTDIPTKDQGSSGSCGGQACAYDEEVDVACTIKSWEEKSAKFIYAPVARPGGGSTQGDLINRILYAGVCSEKLCPSYNTGNPPDETFMSNIKDITPEAIRDAAAAIGWKPVYINMLSENEVAKAVAANRGIVVGLYGVNNGSWLSADPRPPVGQPNNTFWGHWVYVGKARIRNTLRKYGIKNSWGNSVGENGWQYLGPDYLPYIFSAFTLVYVGVPHFKHIFTKTMKLGSRGLEVQALQNALKVDGEFPKDQALTQYFGVITDKAVRAFQLKYKDEILTPAGLTAPTGNVGPNTIKKLNQLFGG